MPELPWLDYEAQTAAELVACKYSHRIDSLLCAFEEGIRNKVALQGSVSDEERLVLAVMELDREVNNGGHGQFFKNSSRRFAPIIVDYLQRIQCDQTATVVADAIAALRLTVITEEKVLRAIEEDDPGRDKILANCDRRFYQLDEIESRLFAFIEAHRNEIELARSPVPRRRTEPFEVPTVTKLYAHVLLSRTSTQNLADARQLVKELAQREDIAATELEVEGAAALYALRCCLKTGDLSACEPLAQRAFELLREDTTQSVLRREWVIKLIGASQAERADAATLEYLRYLQSSDQSTESTQNRVRFWAAPLQEHGAALPRSVEFFITNFPSINLDEPLPGLRVIRGKRPK